MPLGLRNRIRVPVPVVLVLGQAAGRPVQLPPVPPGPQNVARRPVNLSERRTAAD